MAAIAPILYLLTTLAITQLSTINQIPINENAQIAFSSALLRALLHFGFIVIISGFLTKIWALGKERKEEKIKISRNGLMMITVCLLISETIGIFRNNSDGILQILVTIILLAYHRRSKQKTAIMSISLGLIFSIISKISIGQSSNYDIGLDLLYVVSKMIGYVMISRTLSNSDGVEEFTSLLYSLSVLTILPGVILLMIIGLDEFNLNIRMIALITSLEFIQFIILMKISIQSISFTLNTLIITILFNSIENLNHYQIIPFILSITLLQIKSNSPILLQLTPTNSRINSPSLVTFSEKNTLLVPSTTSTLKIPNLLKPILLLSTLLLYKQFITPALQPTMTRFTSTFSTAPTSNSTFADYLEERFPLSDRNHPHIWLTLGGDGWETEIMNNIHFIDELNTSRAPLRRTEVIVLCVDSECMNFCEKNKIWAFGGYQFNRSDMLLKYTYPKLQGLVDILTTGRDTFFFDADVYFKSDPYPYMPLNDYDLIMSDNIRFAHGNTGWSFTKSTSETIQLYQTVINLNLESESRDQIRTNEVLETTFGREIIREEEVFDVRSDFLSSNADFPETVGIKVHILDVDRFTAFHYLFDAPKSSRHSSVFLHLTCADSGIPRRSYLARTQGFGGDSNGYYSDPKQLLTIEDFAGGAFEILTRFKILLAAAHYSNRAVIPPSTGSMADLYIPELPTDPPTRDQTRQSYSLFPFADLAIQLKVAILEPDYVDHATEYILRKENLHRSHDDNLNLIRELQSNVEIDLRSITSFHHLIQYLSKPEIKKARVVHLVGIHLSNEHLLWHLPSTVENVDFCYDIRKMVECGEICKQWPGAPNLIDSDWDDLGNSTIRNHLSTFG